MNRQVVAASPHGELVGWVDHPLMQERCAHQVLRGLHEAQEVAPIEYPALTEQRYKHVVICLLALIIRRDAYLKVRLWAHGSVLGLDLKALVAKPDIEIKTILSGSLGEGSEEALLSQKAY